MDRLELVALQRREGGGDRLDRPGPSRAVLGQRDPQQLQTGPMVEQQLTALFLVDGRRVLQDDAQVIGQFRSGRAAVVEVDA